MEVIILLFIVGWLMGKDDKEKRERQAPPRPSIREKHHRHELGMHEGVYIWHTHIYDGARMHWHPTSTSTEPMFYSDETPNPLNAPIVIDSKEE